MANPIMKEMEDVLSEEGILVIKDLESLNGKFRKSYTFRRDYIPDQQTYESIFNDNKLVIKGYSFHADRNKIRRSSDSAIQATILKNRALRLTWGEKSERLATTAFENLSL